MKGLGVIFAGGVLFGFGLGYSDLLRQEVVLSFLYLDDLGLVLTMGAALVVSMPIYQLATRNLAHPVLGGRFERFPKDTEKSHVAGGVIFGVGWGISGVCPGAAIASLGIGNWPMLAGLAGMLFGAFVQGIVAEPPDMRARAAS